MTFMLLALGTVKSVCSSGRFDSYCWYCCRHNSLSGWRKTIRLCISRWNTTCLRAASSLLEAHGLRW